MYDELYSHNLQQSWKCVKFKGPRACFYLFTVPLYTAICIAILDSPRMSRMDRNSRSVSQPRGKRDSSVSSAYGGGILWSLRSIPKLSQQLKTNIGVTIHFIIFLHNEARFGVGSFSILHGYKIIINFG